MGSPSTFTCSVWRSWSQDCSLWSYGWPIPSNCCTSSSTKSLSCCPGGRNRRTKVGWSTSVLLNLQRAVCVFLKCVCVLSSAGLGDVLHSDRLWGSHDSPGGSHHVHLPAVGLLSNKGWLPHIFIHMVTSTRFTSFWSVKSQRRSHVKQDIRLCKQHVLFSLSMFQTENTITKGK